MNRSTLSTDLAVSIRGISKVYEIRHNRAPEHGVGNQAGFFNRLRWPSSRATREKFSALDDVSFDVAQGEVVGLIGRNGAGKSTLLKILSRITEPTAGEIDLYGRVGSLLEVGTGFHPELTGRENVFLNGSLLGMHNADIRRRFDDIVSFAEVEKFIDTPVKRYSSGMYVRLAFAVAAHLNPEILIVDEVLAVGDLNFQKKCLTHMSRLHDQGMTIFLVSHNMAAIQTCCTRGIVLDRGAVVCDGAVLPAIEKFRSVLRQCQPNSTAVASNAVEISAFEMFGPDGTECRTLRFGQTVRIRIHINAERRIDHPLINFGIRRGDGVIICNFNNWYDDFHIDYIEGNCVLEGWFPPLRLVPDFYEIHVQVWPWGGGHLEGDLTGSTPYATAAFGDFSVEGVGLNFHDGVYQTPAIQWRFQRGNDVVDYNAMTPESIFDVFKPIAD